MDKRCTKCKEVKPLEFFGKQSKSKDGLRYYCKACSNASNKAWRETNPEKGKAASKAWNKANPDRYAAISGKSRAIGRGGSLSDIYDLELCIAFYTESRRLTIETGIQHHVDHIIPLAKGGLHCQTNLQVLTAKENREKRDNL